MLLPYWRKRVYEVSNSELWQAPSSLLKDRWSVAGGTDYDFFQTLGSVGNFLFALLARSGHTGHRDVPTTLHRERDTVTLALA